MPSKLSSAPKTPPDLVLGSIQMCTSPPEFCRYPWQLIYSKHQLAATRSALDRGFPHHSYFNILFCRHRFVCEFHHSILAQEKRININYSISEAQTSAMMHCTSAGEPGHASSKTCSAATNDPNRVPLIGIITRRGNYHDILILGLNIAYVHCPKYVWNRYRGANSSNRIIYDSQVAATAS